MFLVQYPQHNVSKVAELTGALYVMQHCAGVNALASWREEAKLFTASKDSTVKRCGHTDFVHVWTNSDKSHMGHA